MLELELGFQGSKFKFSLLSKHVNLSLNWKYISYNRNANGYEATILS